MRFRFYFLFIIFIICCVCVSFALVRRRKCEPCIEHTTTIQNIPVAQTKQDVTKPYSAAYFAAQEQSIWQELERIGVSKKQFDEIYETEIGEKIDTKNLWGSKRINEYNKKLVMKTMQEEGINPQETIITGCDLQTPAAATSNVFYLNEFLFNQLPDHDSKIAVIRHELSHMKHKDSFVRAIIAAQLDTTLEKACCSNANHPLCKLARLHELRADCEASLYNQQSARGLLTFLHHYNKRFGRFNMPTHPTYNERIKIAEYNNNLFKETHTRTLVRCVEDKKTHSYELNKQYA